MGPQEHAFRSGVDVIVATPGRLLDHMQAAYAKLGKLEYLVLDEADRMLDMGFLPDIRRSSPAARTKRQTLFFSATMPAPIAELSHEMLQRRRRSTWSAVGAGRGHHAGRLPGRRRSSRAAGGAAARGDMPQALVFTRTKHRANRLARPAPHGGHQGRASTATARSRSAPRRWPASRTALRRCWWPPTSPRAASTWRRWARGQLRRAAHAPEDYIHRVGRTARAEATGDAFTFVAPRKRATSS
jgi:ATP-dependent RNA helicase RhlE